MGKQVQFRTHGAQVARQLIGGLHLPHDLRLAEHLRVEARRHANQMAGRVLIPIAVDGALQFIHRHGAVRRQPLGEGGLALRLNGAVQLRAVAGGENGRLGHARHRLGHFHER